MSEASFASLGPTLLARKGGAKPAMRPQLAPLPETTAGVDALGEDQLEDLGWNDMGSDDGDADQSAEIVSIKAKGNPRPANEDAPESDSPIVVRQQKKLAQHVFSDAAKGESEELGLPSAKKARKPRKSPKKAKAAKSGRRAAFTLRLDSDRHLKLRLASTMQGVSAQALVTEALDAMLEQIDDLDALAQRMKRN